MTKKISPARPEAEWRELVAEMQASGLSQSAWCRAHGINHKTISNWVSKFRNESGASRKAITKARFVDVGAIKAEPKPPNPSAITIGLTGYTVSVTTGFDLDALETVLKVLVSL
ncbi:MAG: helix-turn-helix domain-containing protein [Coriobacteriia bacterium]|nr:helix-turn-helix domain-containing protein [Coriobacteriia bacterium]